VNGNDLVGETAETVLGIVGNFRSIRIMIAMCSTDVESLYFITD
jgi:hypothetical protein